MILSDDADELIDSLGEIEEDISIKPGTRKKVTFHLHGGYSAITKNGTDNDSDTENEEENVDKALTEDDDRIPALILPEDYDSDSEGEMPALFQQENDDSDDSVDDNMTANTQRRKLFNIEDAYNTSDRIEENEDDLDNMPLLEEIVERVQNTTTPLDWSRYTVTPINWSIRPSPRTIERLQYVAHNNCFVPNDSTEENVGQRNVRRNTTNEIKQESKQNNTPPTSILRPPRRNCTVKTKKETPRRSCTVGPEQSVFIFDTGGGKTPTITEVAWIRVGKDTGR